MIDNAFVEQYEPLLNKLTKQFVDQVKAPWDDVKSMAYEGLVIAYNTYDPKRSNMSFVQFAGFAGAGGGPPLFEEVCAAPGALDDEKQTVGVLFMEFFGQAQFRAEEAAGFALPGGAFDEGV
jgi:hypothetical protein